MEERDDWREQSFDRRTCHLPTKDLTEREVIRRTERTPVIKSRRVWGGSGCCCCSDDGGRGGGDGGCSDGYICG